MGKIAIVADELSDIAEEVKLMASLYDFVYTTGGIGPTHDDVTLEGELVCDCLAVYNPSSSNFRHPCIK